MKSVRFWDSWLYGCILFRTGWQGIYNHLWNFHLCHRLPYSWSSLTWCLVRTDRNPWRLAIHRRWLALENQRSQVNRHLPAECNYAATLTETAATSEPLQYRIATKLKKIWGWVNNQKVKPSSSTWLSSRPRFRTWLVEQFDFCPVYHGKASPSRWVLCPKILSWKPCWNLGTGLSLGKQCAQGNQKSSLFHLIRCFWLLL